MKSCISWLTKKLLAHTGTDSKLSVFRKAVFRTIKFSYYFISGKKFKPPSLQSYKQLLSNRTIRSSLALKIFIDVPFQAYDQLIRNHLIAYMITEPGDMAYLLVAVGLSTIITNTFLIHKLQR